MKKIILTTTCIVFLCVLCISLVRLILAPLEDSNKRIDKIKNVIKVSSLEEKLKDNLSQKEWEDIFEKYFKVIYWNIQEKKTSTSKEYQDNNKLLYIRDSLISIPEIEEIIPVYVFKKEDKQAEIIIPVYGKGLWSTMYGFVSIVGEKYDTLGRILFYEHGETPGLGDGITRKEWTDKFRGKKVFDNKNMAATSFEIVKGGTDSQDKDIDHKVDGISGATLTSKGVERIVNFWLSFGMMGYFLDLARSDPGFLDGCMKE